MTAQPADASSSGSQSPLPPTHAGGLVVRETAQGRRYLLVRARRDPREWVLPKGHIDPGESPAQAALREVREEAGVRAEIGELLATHGYRVGEEDVRVVFYSMRYGGEAPSGERRDPIWCSYEQALERLSFEDARELVRSLERSQRARPDEQGSSGAMRPERVT